MVASIFKISISRNANGDNMVGFPKSGHIYVAVAISEKLLQSNVCTIYLPFKITLVPTPFVNVTALSNQTVGQSLTLQCEVTTVRGITSRVDIVWSSNGTELERTDGITPTIMDNSLVYTDSYTISQLSTTDDGRVIQCEVVIDVSPSVMADDNITLDVTGK